MSGGTVCRAPPERCGLRLRFFAALRMTQSADGKVDGGCGMKSRLWIAGWTVLLIGLTVGLFAMAPPREVIAQGGTPTPDEFNSNIFMWDGGNLMVVASGGEIEVQDGGFLDVGGPAKFSGANTTATPMVLVAPSTAQAGNVFEVRNPQGTPVFSVNKSGTLSHATFPDLSAPYKITVPTAQATATPGLQVDSLAADGDTLLVSKTGGTPVARIDKDGNISGVNLVGSGTFAMTGLSTLTGGASIPVNVENLRVPTWLSVPITYTAAAGGTGVVATIGAGEVWAIHGVWVEVTTNFDCTGDDATLVIGDGNDADGFLTLADAELQAADTEGTGFSAGWQGMTDATVGDYMDATIQGFIYDEATAETIDYLIDETSGETLTAGAATITIWYTRLE